MRDLGPEIYDGSSRDVGDNIGPHCASRFCVGRGNRCDAGAARDQPGIDFHDYHARTDCGLVLFCGLAS